MTATAAPKIEPTYIPVWPGVIEGWVRNFVHKNVWRVEPEYDADDLYQEAYVVFEKVKARYQGKPNGKTEYTGENAWLAENRVHFFNLFRTACFRHFCDLSEKFLRVKRPFSLSGQPEEDAPDLTQIVAAKISVLDQVRLHELVQQAPVELRRLLTMLLTEGVSVPPMSFFGVRETRRQTLARGAGLPDDDIDAAMENLEFWAKKSISA